MATRKPAKRSKKPTRKKTPKRELKAIYEHTPTGKIRSRYMIDVREEDWSKVEVDRKGHVTRKGSQTLKKIADKLWKTIEEKHGKGGRRYAEQHFVGLFTGKEYSIETNRPARQQHTYGTQASTSLKKVIEELVSRLKALREGMTPGGPMDDPMIRDPQSKRPGYGTFNVGPSEIEISVIEEEEDEDEEGHAEEGEKPIRKRRKSKKRRPGERQRSFKMGQVRKTRRRKS